MTVMRTALLSLASAAALLASPLQAVAAPSSGMDQTGKGVQVATCGTGSCLDLAATGTATGKPFPSADFDVVVHNLTASRPRAGQCVKVGVDLHLYQSTPTSMDTFHADGTGKWCAAADGVGTVTSKYSGGGYVGPEWAWGGGQGSLTATFGTDGSMSFRATGNYSVSPLK